MNNKKLVQCWIDIKEYQKLMKLAKDLRRSKASLTQEALEDFLNKDKS